MGWIGVDLDHTLATYEEGMATKHLIGSPIMPMVRRVRRWLAEGREVRIMTARVNKIPGWDDQGARRSIEAWCEIVFGKKLQVTNEKDFAMIELWDDRAVRVEADTGRKLSPSLNLRAADNFMKANRG